MKYNHPGLGHFIHNYYTEWNFFVQCLNNNFAHEQPGLNLADT